MKLLIITQKVNKNDPVLGFFHRWITEFSKKFESITVICLEKGEYALPQNVRVLSLGKEVAQSKWQYIRKFYGYIFSERKNYDAVFVHMNQEYVILGGILWKIFGKRVYMWRNHHAGSEFTDIAVSLCTKVFCPSKYSYTAKFKKAVFMPVGIDTSWFIPTAPSRQEHSILFLGRIAPIKRPDLFIKALGDLRRRGIRFSATIVGDPLPKDASYAESLKKIASEEGVAENIVFHKGISNDETRDFYSKHEICVNLSTSGMYDKTIFEAMACESLMLASNENLRSLIGEEYIFQEGYRNELVQKLEYLLKLSDAEKMKRGRELRRVTLENHSLEKLSHELDRAMN